MTQILTVILNWRTAEMTLRSAGAALRAMEGLTGAITIVDNDSGDGSYERMTEEVAARGWDRAETPVRVLQSGHNGGFGAGNNVAIRAGLPAGFPGGTRPDYVYVLNSDAFPEPDAISVLRDYLEAHPRTGFAGSFIYGEDGVPHQTAFRFPSAASEFESHLRLGIVSRFLKNRVVALPLSDEIRQVDWMAGASLMMRQDMLDEIGLFDERFFLYFEETDLSLRGARAGWGGASLPASRVMHIGSVSTGMGRWKRVPGFWLDSRLHYFSKNHGRGGAFLATLAAASGAALWRARLLVQKKDRGDPPFYLRDLLKHHVSRGFRAIAPRSGAAPEKDPS